jgi:hypothetical protein
MVTFEVKVKDGRIYKLRNSVSTKDAMEYISVYMRGDDTPLPQIEETEDEAEVDVKALANSAIEATCRNLKDADWLIRHVLVDCDPDSVPLHHTYQLIKPMRKAIHWGDLIDVVNSYQTEPDPDFPEDEEKNSQSASG